MASLRDAHKRLQVIYNATAPEAIEQNAAEAGLDEFTRLQKKTHKELKNIREALKERDLASKKGTTTETAETSYRIRVMIKTVRENYNAMFEIYTKKAKKKPTDPEKIAQLQHWNDIVELAKQHLEEVEMMEKRRVNEATAGARLDLMGNALMNNDHVNMGDGGYGEVDPYASNLPDIDVDKDLAEISNRNKQIDSDIAGLSKGINQLKDIAIDMGRELDNQNELITNLDKKAEEALDHVDNLNVTLKKAVTGIMKGDKFMVNAILLCVLLAVGAFIATQFLVSQ